MRLVDAGEALGQKEGLARPCKLTKAQVKKETFCDHGEKEPFRDFSFIYIIA